MVDSREENSRVQDNEADDTCYNFVLITGPGVTRSVC